MQATGELGWGESGVNSFTEQCVARLEGSVKNWVDNKGTLAPDSARVAKLCPNDCSSHGTCNTGQMCHMINYNLNLVIIPVDNNEHQRIDDVSTDRIFYGIQSLETMGFA